MKCSAKSTRNHAMTTAAMTPRMVTRLRGMGRA
jgi:hypothetical protein